MHKGLIVQKFGGTSVGSIQAIIRSSCIVKQEISKGFDVVVVVSAMSGVTSDLVKQVEEFEVTENTDIAGFERDLVLSSGEQVTSGLFSLALLSNGVKARSWLGWQLPIITSADCGQSIIDRIEVEGLLKAIKRGWVNVVAGFQGLCENRITTLGRGGSDISAVALAAVLGAERCDIYTDVEGIFSADPSVVHNVSRLASVSYDEMLELSSSGALVLHPRSVSLAMRYGVEVRVISSFNPGAGHTILVRNEGLDMEKSVVTGLALVEDEVVFTISSKDSCVIFELLANKKILVNTVIQNFKGGNVDFTVKKTDKEKVYELISGYGTVLHSEIATVSIVGSGMMLSYGVVSQMFSTLLSNGIGVLGVTTSEIKVSVVLSSKDAKPAMRVLHSVFGLDHQ